jgi:hypothetical protein
MFTECSLNVPFAGPSPDDLMEVAARDKGGPPSDGGGSMEEGELVSPHASAVGGGLLMGGGLRTSFKGALHNVKGAVVPLNLSQVPENGLVQVIVP